eukprot:7090871-Alexandrium_andersonii.AAC.1
MSLHLARSPLLEAVLRATSLCPMPRSTPCCPASMVAPPPQCLALGSVGPPNAVRRSYLVQRALSARAVRISLPSASAASGTLPGPPSPSVESTLSQAGSALLGGLADRCAQLAEHDPRAGSSPRPPQGPSGPSAARKEGRRARAACVRALVPRIEMRSRRQLNG